MFRIIRWWTDQGYQRNMQTKEPWTWELYRLYIIDRTMNCLSSFDWWGICMVWKIIMLVS